MENFLYNLEGNMLENKGSGDETHKAMEKLFSYIQKPIGISYVDEATEQHAEVKEKCDEGEVCPTKHVHFAVPEERVHIIFVFDKTFEAKFEQRICLQGHEDNAKDVERKKGPVKAGQTPKLVSHPEKFCHHDTGYQGSKPADTF